MINSELKSLPNEDICIQIKLDNYSGSFICDCGDASLLTIKDCLDTKAIFISHTHIDHFVNFDFFLRHQLGSGKNFIICGPEGITDHVKNRIRSYTWNLIEKESVSYEVREVISPEKVLVTKLCPPNWDINELGEVGSNVIYQDEKLQVQFGVLDHKTPSICYKFQERDRVKIDVSKSNHSPGKWIKQLKDAFENKEPEREIEVEGKRYFAKAFYHLLEIKKGATLGVIMDHAANESNHEKIRGLFTNCDKVLIESYYKAEDRELAIANYHSYSTASAEIMRKCKVKEAVPVHFSRKYDENDLAQIALEFKNELKNSIFT